MSVYTDEQRQKMSESAKRRWASERQRKLQSKRLRAFWAEMSAEERSALLWTPERRAAQKRTIAQRRRDRVE
jgi:hypothetical protein